MKKTVLPIFTVLMSMFLLGSCATGGTAFVFDELLPESDVATINWAGFGCNIVEYNDIAVDWKAGLFSYPVIKIPEGEARFILNGITDNGVWIVNYRNVPFVYYFEGGKEYTVHVSAWIINVYGVVNRKANLITRFNMRDGRQEEESD